jgi:hypothetical protein
MDLPVPSMIKYEEYIDWGGVDSAYEILWCKYSENYNEDGSEGVKK